MKKQEEYSMGDCRCCKKPVHYKDGHYEWMKIEYECHKCAEKRDKYNYK